MKPRIVIHWAGPERVAQVVKELHRDFGGDTKQHIAYRDSFITIHLIDTFNNRQIGVGYTINPLEWERTFCKGAFVIHIAAKLLREYLSVVKIETIVKLGWWDRGRDYLT